LIPVDSKIYVGNARTALKIAFLQLNVQAGKHVLVPDTICDVLIHPITQSNLVPKYYPINDQFIPDWNTLEMLATSYDCHSLVMVHFFGQPQDIEKYRSFCMKHKLILIEDNAHGYGGFVSNKPLGTFGDIGICSPRKMLSIPSGGVLYGNVSVSKEIINKLHSFPVFRLRIILKMALTPFHSIKRILRAWNDKRKDWCDPFLYQESIQPDYKIDYMSHRCIELTNWQEIAKRRRVNWIAWADFAKRNGLELVFHSVHPESCPWAMPVYAKSINERNEWLRWGTVSRVALFPWPSLPDEVIALEGKALDRWKTLICFPLDTSPEELGVY